MRSKETNQKCHSQGHTVLLTEGDSGKAGLEHGERRVPVPGLQHGREQVMSAVVLSISVTPLDSRLPRCDVLGSTILGFGNLPRNLKQVAFAQGNALLQTEKGALPPEVVNIGNS